MNPMVLECLYTVYKNKRGQYPESFRLRVHRSLSWLKKVVAEPEDLDIQFIALWISFNAAYAKNFKLQLSTADRSEFRSFITQICLLDKKQEIYNLIWKTYSGSIRLLLDSPYTQQAYWDYHNGIISETAWQQTAHEAKIKVKNALSMQETDSLLYIVFDRLYTLRNQLVHGGSTYNSSANRKQLQDACHLLCDLIPLFLTVMMAHSDNNCWGEPFYPFVLEA